MSLIEPLLIIAWANEVISFAGKITATTLDQVIVVVAIFSVFGTARLAIEAWKHRKSAERERKHSSQLEDIYKQCLKAYDNREKILLEGLKARDDLINEIHKRNPCLVHEARASIRTHVELTGESMPLKD